MRLSWALPLSAALPIWAATSGDFSVLSFNVAGLPAIFNSNGVPGDKTTNSEIIGSRFAKYGYDIIQVQEVCIYPLRLRKLINGGLQGFQLPCLCV